MASIDRYRPAREGYQPPALPSDARHDDHPLPSRSPPRRSDVPPAVPTPPSHRSRASPGPLAHAAPPCAAVSGHSPRSNSQPQSQPQPQSQSQSQPQSQPQSQSQSQSQPQPEGQTPSPPANQWYFSSDEIHSTPSIIEGIAPSEERLRRAKGVNFIYQVGVMLDLPQITLWVAAVFFHRFYMRCSMVEEKGGIHHYNIAATALFLANKVEENCRKTKDIIIAVAKVAQKNTKLIIDEQSKEYWRWRDSILTYEEVMLEQLTFDLRIDNPYRPLYDLLEALDMIHNKHLRQTAWAFCNDACLTALPLLIEARDVAISSIFFASVHTNQQIDDVHGEAWWRFLEGDADRCTRAIDVMRQFYMENPLRKQNPSLPSPAFDLENTRRRAETLSSTGGTPRDGDRASHSPAVRTNGGLEGVGDSRHGSGDTATRSPLKRSIVPSSEESRSEKRTKLSEDEGELVEG